MSSDMETLLLVLGGAVEGMTTRRDRNSSVRRPVMRPAARSALARTVAFGWAYASTAVSSTASRASYSYP
jgi:hypothetical protein